MRRIFGAGEARNFKFGVWIDPGKCHLMTDKIPPKWAWSGSRVEFLNFKTPYLNSERVKLETLNVKSRTMIDLGKYHLEHDEIPKKGHGQGPVTKN